MPWGTEQGAGAKGKGRAVGVCLKILICLGVEKGSEGGEVRTGRCHIGVGGSTGFESTLGIGFNTDCPAVVSA